LDEKNKKFNLGLDYEKIRNATTTFEYDREFSFKAVDNLKDEHMNSEYYYSTFSCNKVIHKVQNKVLFL